MASRHDRRSTPSGCGARPGNRHGFPQSTSCRSQHQRARPVQPLQVVDDHEQRSSRRGIAKQPKDRIRDHQPIGRLTLIQPKRDAQRVAIQRRKRPEPVEEWMQHVAEPRKAHLRFELRADAPNDTCPNSLCPQSGNLEQHRLADSGVTRQQQRATATAASSTNVQMSLTSWSRPVSCPGTSPPTGDPLLVQPRLPGALQG